MDKHRRIARRCLGESKRSGEFVSNAERFLYICVILSCVAAQWAFGVQGTERVAEARPGGQEKRAGGESAAAALGKTKADLLKVAERLINDFPKNEEALLLMGNVHENYGETVEAEKFWQKALAINPKRADVHYTIAMVAVRKGEHERAVDYFRRALEVDPNMAGVRTRVASSLMFQGKLVEAIVELEKDARAFPQGGFSRYLLGQAYLQQREYEKAKESYEIAIKLDPANTSAYYGIAMACAGLGETDSAQQYREKFKQLKLEDRRNLKDRKVGFDDALEMRRRTAQSYVHAAEIYLAHRRLPEGVEFLEKATALEPKNVEYLFALASVYQDVNRLADSARVLGQAAAADPNNPMACRELARVHLRTGGRASEARRLAERAVSLEASAVNYFVLAWACHANKDTQAALAAIQKAIALDPDDIRYKRVYDQIKKGN